MTTTTTTTTNLIFGFGLVIRSSIEIYCEHWFYSKGMPSAFVSKSLLTNSSFIDSFSDVCTTPSPLHCGIIYSFFGSIPSIPKFILLAETTNHSHTHSLSWISIAFVLFLTQLIDSTTTGTTQIRRFHHQSMGGIINFSGLSVSLC